MTEPEDQSELATAAGGQSLAEKIRTGNFHAFHQHSLQGSIVFDTDGAWSVRPDGTRKAGVDLDFLDVHTVINGRKPRSEGVEAPETAQ